MRHRRYIAIGAWLAAGMVGVALFYALHPAVIPDPRQGDFRVLQHIDPEPVRITFTGDVFLGRDVERRIMNRGAAQTVSFLNNVPASAALVINFESTVPETHVPTPDFGWEFSVPTWLVDELAAVGVTHAGLANNHTFDHGRDGYAHTRESLSAAGIKPFGHPSRVNRDSVSVIDTGAGSVGLVGLHTLYGAPSLHSIRDTVAQIDATVDRLVAYVHWGEEYAVRHNSEQRAFAEQLVALGFDLIVGHHPHVVQGVEMIDEVPVVYSLGNTIFDQYFSTDVQQGLIVSYTFTEESDRLDFLPITSLESRAAPRFMDADESAQFLITVADRGSEAVAPAVAGGQLEW